MDSCRGRGIYFDLAWRRAEGFIVNLYRIVSEVNYQFHGKSLPEIFYFKNSGASPPPPPWILNGGPLFGKHLQNANV